MREREKTVTGPTPFNNPRATLLPARAVWDSVNFLIYTKELSEQ